MANCLACGGEDLKLVLDLGQQPLANDYVNHETYPLELLACQNCYHAQLSLFIKPEKLYRHYSYVSGTSNTLRYWFKDFASRFEYPGTILDIASNDGSLLRQFKDKGWEVLGVDPASNIDTQGIPTVEEFFSQSSDLGRYDVITAFNVLAHVPNPLSLLKGIKKHLNPSGTAYIMTSQAFMFDSGQFDTIYHEHHSYFCPKSFQTLANRAGFTDIEMSIEPIHGGSFMFKLTKDKRQTQLSKQQPDFEGFVTKAKAVKPYKIIGYGAAAKGVVVINALGQNLDYVIDEAPLKIGKKIPGTDIWILGPETLSDEEDNLLIIVYAWNFYDEIVEKIKKLRPNRNDILIRYWHD